jgi:nitrogen-specific signal transduction histidine kinase
MALTKLELIGELKHGINSPLAAIRNALYLAAVRSNDPELKRYLRLADDEVSRISAILKNANQMDENKGLHSVERNAAAASAA